MFAVIEKSSIMFKNFLEKQTNNECTIFLRSEKVSQKEKPTDSEKKGFFAALFGSGDGYYHIHSAPNKQEKEQPTDKQEIGKNSLKNVFYIKNCTTVRKGARRVIQNNR